MGPSLVASKEAASTKFLKPQELLTQAIVKEYVNCGRGSLPFLTWRRGEGLLVEISMIAPNRVGNAMFFYEMISRWLIPLRQLHVLSYFAFEEKIGQKEAILASIQVEAATERELRSIEMMLPILFDEVRLGLLSSYHAKRILEIKGLSSGDKMGFVLDHLRKVIKRFPEYYDYDLIPLMQRFFIHKSDEYRNNRSVLALEKTLLRLYWAQKRLQRNRKENRSIDVRIHTHTVTQLFGEKKVLAVTIGVSHMKDTERFTEQHLERAISEAIPSAHILPESFYVEVHPEERSRVYTVEIEFESDPPKEAIISLYHVLPQAIQMHIEQLTKPLVMPRNDEEVMKHMILLSGQISSPKDIPQMILSFSEQTEHELVFTVILARVLKEGMQKMHSLVDGISGVKLERVRERGFVWKKYPKELSVLRVTIALSLDERLGKRIPFMRARNSVQELVEGLIGPVRDYFGGMYEKEQRQIEQVWEELKEEGVSLSEIELFYQGLFPTESRSTFASGLIADLFRLYGKVKAGLVSETVQIEGNGRLFMRRFEDKHLAFQTFQQVKREGKYHLHFFREELGWCYLGGQNIS